MTQPGPSGATQTVYDADGNVTATFDPLGRVTATSYDDFGKAAETYQGQVEPGGTAFQNLSPNATASYDVYSTGAAMPAGRTGPHRAMPTHWLGSNWHYYGSITSTASSLTLTSSGDVCLLEQTSATAYDDDGNVTATISGMGRVTASTYDELGNDVADYQGQALAAGSGSATFSNLAPNSNLSYDVYVYSASGSVDISPSNYTLTNATQAGDDPTYPSLGDGWQFLETVTSSAASLGVGYKTGGSEPPGEICLLQQTSATVYDADGNVTATIDAMGRVSASLFDQDGNDVADYQGQIVSSTSGVVGYYNSGSNYSWTFGSLTPNVGLSYIACVYAPSGGGYTIAQTGQTTGLTLLPASDPADSPLGDGWYDLGTVTAPIGHDLADGELRGAAPAGAVCLVQQTTATVYDADGNTLSVTDGLGRVTTNSYNDLDQLAQHQGPGRRHDHVHL